MLHNGSLVACSNAEHYQSDCIKDEEDMQKDQFFKRVKGPMDNYEDWYYLVRDADGQLSVEHSWCHVTPSLQSDSGSEIYTIEDFMKSRNVHTGAQVALRDRLAED